MADYRDYGRIGGVGKTNVAVSTDKYGQVYLATHDGTKRLPYMNRSFISFTYGGKPIEDFNLIATISNNRMERNGYSSFEDQTSSYENLEGQRYWGTHYKTNTLDLQLSTDGIDQKMLDQFLAWFSAGTIKELILAEHPNRAQLARIAQPPALHLLPFETTTSMKIAGETYEIKTTLFKGEIDLSFIMDTPHWYAKETILGKLQDGHYINKWTDANGTTVNVSESQDALKILYEDGIPLGSMIDNNMFLGNQVYATAENPSHSLIFNTVTQIGARIEANNATAPYTLGVIAGASINVGTNGVISTMASGGEGYLFYAGTAPAYTIIEFDLQPTIQSNEDKYILIPRNSHSDTSTKYNSFTITSTTSQILKFTTPNIYTSYNEAMTIFDEMIAPGNIWEDVYAALRDRVRHAGVRAWASAIMARYGEDIAEGTITNDVDTGLMKLYLSYFLKDLSGNIQKAHFKFNSETGEAKGKFKYRKPKNKWNDGDTWETWGTITTVTEDVGDMLLSNYIILKERNYFTSAGRVSKWTSSNKTLSHKFTHDVENGLTNIQISYKVMYL